MGFKYSVNCDTFKWVGYDVFENPHECLAAVKAAGYDGADIGGNLERARPEILKPIADGLGLAIPEVLCAWAYFHAGENRDLSGTDAEGRNNGIQYARAAIDLAAQLGAQYIEICAAQPPIPQVPFPATPISLLRENFRAACREICAYAASRGITVLFEPLNLYEAYPGVMTSVYDAIRVIDELGGGNLGIQPDVYHMNISESSTLDALRAAGKRIRVVHLNETNHYRLGAGHADLKGILRTLKEIGFDGYLSIYMPLIAQGLLGVTAAGYGRTENASATHVVERPSLQQVLEMQLEYAKALERAVDAQLEIGA